MSTIGPIDSFARSLSALIRGPAHLREDIADEIADHLTTRVEEEIAYGGKSVDPAAVQAEALAAFGDPKTIARELRSIHLGDWIMFQRIMVAALVVIVIGMAATAYFSWSAAQQQSRQFAKMNDQLASLVELQQAANSKAEMPAKVDHRDAAATQQEKSPIPEPPLAIIQFVANSPDKPVPGYKVMVDSFLNMKTGEKTADENGCIELTDRGKHRIWGNLFDAAGQPREGALWSQIVSVPTPAQAGSPNRFVIDVASRNEYEIHLDLSATNWNPAFARRLSVTFTEQIGENHTPPKTAGFYQRPYFFDRERHIDQTIAWPESSGNRMVGLLPGPATVTVQLLANPEDITWSDDSSLGAMPEGNDVVLQSWRNIEIMIPEQPGSISIKLQPDPALRMTVVFFDGSRDRPLAGVPVKLMKYFDNPIPSRTGGRPMVPAVPQPPRPGRPRPGRGIMPGLAAGADATVKSQTFEHLLTNQHGEFTSLVPYEISGSTGYCIVLPWHTADGKPADLVWPLNASHVKSYSIADHGMLFELDVAQLGTLRMSFSGAEILLGKGLRFVEPIRLEAPGTMSRYSQNHYIRVLPLTSTINVLNQTTCNLLLFSGEYDIPQRMILAEIKSDDPTLEQYRQYNRTFHKIELPKGQVKELPIALDELDKWNHEKNKDEWHKREAPPTQTQPAKK